MYFSGQSDLSNLELVSDVLAKLTEVRIYSWDELQERPLPENVNPEHLERYLADDEFEVNRKHAANTWCMLIVVCIGFVANC